MITYRPGPGPGCPSQCQCLDARSHSCRCLAAADADWAMTTDCSCRAPLLAPTRAAARFLPRKCEENCVAGAGRLELVGARMQCLWWRRAHEPSTGCLRVMRGHQHQGPVSGVRPHSFITINHHISLARCDLCPVLATLH